jgi:hypothetical protein
MSNTLKIVEYAKVFEDFYPEKDGGWFFILEEGETNEDNFYAIFPTRKEAEEWIVRRIFK